jgi:hypothetical protein
VDSVSPQEALRHEDVWRNGCIDPRFLHLGTSWRLVVSFTPVTSPPPPQGKENLVTIGEGTGWDPQPVWMIWRS